MKVTCHRSVEAPTRPSLQARYLRDRVLPIPPWLMWTSSNANQKLNRCQTFFRKPKRRGFYCKTHKIKMLLNCYSLRGRFNVKRKREESSKRQLKSMRGWRMQVNRSLPLKETMHILKKNVKQLNQTISIKVHFSHLKEARIFQPCLRITRGV